MDWLFDQLKYTPDAVNMYMGFKLYILPFIVIINSPTTYIKIEFVKTSNVSDLSCFIRIPLDDGQLFKYLTRTLANIRL